MIIGRQKELAELERLYARRVFQMPVVYGRRRVGKTTFIREFCSGKESLFFTAVESSAEKNLELLSSVVLHGTGTVFSSFEAAFEKIAGIGKEKRVVFVIDEYPYLANAEPSVSSLLQRAIDLQFKNTQVMLILCGSSMSFMEQQVLGYKSPLYGRRTAQFKILPFDYSASAEFVPRYSPEDKSLVYGITGGIPRYLELIDDTVPLPQNIVRQFFSPQGYLFEEPSNLLKQELRDAARYNSVIEAIAEGATRLNGIAEKCRLESGITVHCIETLMSLGIVQKESCITEESNRKKSFYRVNDLLFRFWYRFVPDGLTAITSGNGEAWWDMIAQEQIPQYMGLVFERMCRSWILTQSSKRSLPFTVLNIGRWWGTDPGKKQQEEIDIVAVSPYEKSALFAECKYHNTPADEQILVRLIEKASLVPGFAVRRYFIFSKSGFTPGLIRTAGERQARLVTLDELYG